MYLRRCRRKKNGEEYESWLLVESVRTARGPRQKTVAKLGKQPGLNKEERIGWEDIAWSMHAYLSWPASVPHHPSYRLQNRSLQRLRWMIC